MSALTNPVATKLDDDDYRGILRLAMKKGVTPSVIVREACKNHIVLENEIPPFDINSLIVKEGELI